MKYTKPNTKPVPILITLAAAGISCVVSILRGEDFSSFFRNLLLTVIIFGILGCFVRIFLDMGFKADEKEEEKKAEAAEAEQAEAAGEDGAEEKEAEPEEEKEQ